MEQKSGCVVCGKELCYQDQAEELRCMFCNNVFSTQAKCVANHFVCDACHSLSANDLIERFTIAPLGSGHDDIELWVSSCILMRTGTPS